MKRVFGNRKVLMWYMALLPFLLLVLDKELSQQTIIPLNLLLIYGLFGLYFTNLCYKSVSFRKRKIWIPIVLIASFLIICILSILHSVTMITSLYTIVKFLGFFMLGIIYSRTEFKKEEEKLIWKFLILGAILLVVYGFIQYLFRIDLSNAGIHKYAPARGRIRTTFFNTIYFGIFLAFMIAIGYQLLDSISPKQHKRIIICIVGLILFSLALCLTFTRSALLIMVGMVGLFYLLKLIFCHRIHFFRALLTFSVTLLIILLIPGVNRLITNTVGSAYTLYLNPMLCKVSQKLCYDSNKLNTGEQLPETPPISNPEAPETPPTPPENNENSKPIDASMNGRDIGKKIALTVIKDHSMLGIGVGSYGAYMNTEQFDQQYQELLTQLKETLLGTQSVKFFPHNAYLHLMAETNVLNVILYLAILFSFIFIDLKNHFLKNKIIFSLLCALIVGYCVIMFYESVIYDSQLNAIFFIILGLLYQRLEWKEEVTE